MITYTAKQIAHAAQEALDEWDWTAKDGNDSEKMQAALRHLAANAKPETISGSLWAWLHEYAAATAADA